MAHQQTFIVCLQTGSPQALNCQLFLQMCVVRNLLFLLVMDISSSRISHEIMLFLCFGFQSLVFTDVATIAAADSLFLGGTWESYQIRSLVLTVWCLLNGSYM